MSEQYDLDEIEASANGAVVPQPQRVASAEVDRSDPTEFVTELSAETKVFEAQDVVKLRIGKRVIALRIRSVPKEVLERVMLRYRPKLRKVWDRKQKQFIEDDETPGYRDWLLLHAYAKVVLGLADMTLRNAQGMIIWQSDGPVQDIQGAVHALKAMGITVGHVEAIVTAIDNLSEFEQEDEVQTLLGESNGG